MMVILLSILLMVGMVVVVMMISMYLEKDILKLHLRTYLHEADL